MKRIITSMLVLFSVSFAHADTLDLATIPGLVGLFHFNKFPDEPLKVINEVTQASSTLTASPAWVTGSHGDALYNAYTTATPYSVTYFTDNLTSWTQGGLVTFVYEANQNDALLNKNYDTARPYVRSANCWAQNNNGSGDAPGYIFIYYLVGGGAIYVNTAIDCSKYFDGKEHVFIVSYGERVYTVSIDYDLIYQTTLGVDALQLDASYTLPTRQIAGKYDETWFFSRALLWEEKMYIVTMLKNPDSGTVE